jgi:hypothetical protein
MINVLGVNGRGILSAYAIRFFHPPNPKRTAWAGAKHKTFENARHLSLSSGGTGKYHKKMTLCRGKSPEIRD